MIIYMNTYFSLLNKRDCGYKPVKYLNYIKISIMVVNVKNENRKYVLII